MTLNEIFMEEAYGKDYAKFHTIKESLEKNYDKENDIFHASGRIKDITERFVMEEDLSKLVNHITSKCETVENRLFNEESMSKNYKTVMALSITEDCNKIIDLSNKRGTYEKLPSKEGMAKIVATAKYFSDSYLMEDSCFKKSKSLQFNSMIAEEIKNIEQVL